MNYKRRRTLLLWLATCFCTGVFAQQNLSEVSHPDRKVYPARVEPSNYPEYAKRKLPPPGWDVFDGRMQFKNSNMYQRYYQDTLGLDAFPTHPGVLRLEDGLFSQAKINELISFKNEGGIIYSAGYKAFREPDSKNFHQALHIEGGYSAQVNDLFEKLGGKFLGMNFGEADATFMNLSGGFHYPLSRRKDLQALQFLNHLQYYGGQVGDYILGHHNNCAWVYPAYEGLSVMGGAQLFYRGDTNPRVHYAFFRGVGRQYGVLWQATFSSGTQHDGGKMWWYDKSKQKVPPTKGASLNLQRRALYTAWLWNSTFWGYEMGPGYRWPGNNSEAPLHPRGKMEAQASLLIDQYKNPGVMQTQVAFLLDIFNGWRPIDKRKRQAITWTGIPYGKGDHLTNLLFDLVYPGHTNVGAFINQRYALPETPFGDSFDVLHSDAQNSEMNRYGIIVAAGELQTNPETLKSKLDLFMANGGNFIVTAANAQKLWPELNLQLNAVEISGGANVQWAGNISTNETLATRVATIQAAENMQVVANSQQTPVVVEIAKGEGKLTIILTDWGLNSTEQNVSWPNYKKKPYTQAMQFPYALNNFTSHLLAEKFKSVELFTVSDSLAYIVNYRGNNEFIVGLFNDHLNSVSFEIESNVGDIIEMEEIELTDQFVKADSTYFPHDYKFYDSGADDSTHIYGGDVRLFRIITDGSGFNELADVSHDAYATDRFIQKENLWHLREELTITPEFFYHFDGVYLPAKTLLDCSEFALKRDSAWYERKQLRFIIDARGIENTDTTELILARAALLPNVEGIISGTMASNDSSVNILPEQDFSFRSGLNQVPENPGTVIFDQNYASWDEAYRDASAFEAGELLASLMLKSTIMGNEALAFSTDFSTGNHYACAFDFKAEGNGTCPVNVEISGENGWRETQHFQVKKGSWENLNFSFEVPQNFENGQVRFSFGTNPGTYLLDNISLTANTTLSSQYRDKNSSTLLIYPVPASDRLSYQAEKELKFIEVLDLNGKLQKKILSPDRVGQIDLAGIPMGSYLAKFTYENTTHLRKFIIQ